MPIKGLTDRGEAFPQIGSIRLGAPKKTNAPGKDLDHFRVVFDEGELEAAERFEQVYGTEPRELNVLFPFDEVDRVLDQWLEAYTAGALWYRSDGQQVMFERDPRTGKKLVVNGEPYKPHRDVEGMKPTTRLRVIIPELGRAAYLVLHSTGYATAANLSSQLPGIKLVNNGRLAGVPVKLKRYRAEVSTPRKNGPRVRVTKWLVSVEADPLWVRRRLAAMKLESLPALVAPQQVDLPEGQDDEDEWADNGWQQGELEQEEPAAPEPPQPATKKPVAQSKGQAPDKGHKITTVNSRGWADALAALARDWPHYQDPKTGQANPYHVTGAAYKLGFEQITDDNLLDVIAALEDHALEPTWEALLAQSNASLLHVQAALGTENVREWLDADPGRSLQDALGLVQQQVGE